MVHGSFLKIRGSRPTAHGSWLVASQGSWLMVSQGSWLMASHGSMVHGSWLLKARGSFLKARVLFWLLRSCWSREANIIHDGMSPPIMKWCSHRSIHTCLLLVAQNVHQSNVYVCLCSRLPQSSSPWFSGWINKYVRTYVINNGSWLISQDSWLKAHSYSTT